jgi:hypothetical protein
MGLLPDLPITYRRPTQVDRPVTGDSKASLEHVSSNGDLSLQSSKSNLASGVPPALSFDRIIEGGTCPVSEPLCFPLLRVSVSMANSILALHRPRLYELPDLC